MIECMGFSEVALINAGITNDKSKSFNVRSGFEIDS